MKKLKNIFFALALVAVGASYASAQVQFFVSASGARPLRSEGRTEAVGTIAFAANSAGTIVLASEFTLNYGTLIQDGSGTVNTSCVETNGALSAVAKDNVLTLTIVAAGTSAGMVCGVGDSISVTAARVDANALGEGAEISVTVGASVPAASQATNPITLISIGTLVVGNVQDAPSTDVSFKPTAVLLCDVPEGSATTLDVEVTVEEEFASAFLSETDEIALNDTGLTVPFEILFSFENIPIGVFIGATPDTSGSDTSLGTITTNHTSDFESVAGDQDLDVKVLIDQGAAGTATSAIELLEVIFAFFVLKEADLQDTQGVGTLTVSLEGGKFDDDEAPVFASNIQKADDVIQLQVCDCFLLYSWLPNTGDGAFDSGLTVSNTTADPAIIGTSGQTGDVTLYFWATDGSIPAASPVTLATALGAGETATGVVSTLLGEPFLGYMIARSEFQLCHGFAFINAPQPGTGGAFAQGYLPVIINNPRLEAIVPEITESTGH